MLRYEYVVTLLNSCNDRYLESVITRLLGILTIICYNTLHLLELCLKVLLQEKERHVLTMKCLGVKRENIL